MPKKVVIVGGAGGAKTATDIARSMKREVACYINCYVKDKSTLDYPCFESGELDEDAYKQWFDNNDYFVATGDNYSRKRITETLTKITGKPPINVIHSTASFGGHVILGNGIMIAPFVRVNCYSQIGDGAIINTGAVIEHDCRIRNYAQLSPMSVLLGYTHVEEFAFIGAHATVLPHMRIGKGALVAAGAVVISDVEPEVMVAGCPATIKKILEVKK